MLHRIERAEDCAGARACGRGQGERYSENPGRTPQWPAEGGRGSFQVILSPDPETGSVPGGWEKKHGVSGLPGPHTRANPGRHFLRRLSFSGAVGTSRSRIPGSLHQFGAILFSLTLVPNPPPRQRRSSVVGPRWSVRQRRSSTDLDRLAGDGPGSARTGWRRHSGRRSATTLPEAHLPTPLLA